MNDELTNAAMQIILAAGDARLLINDAVKKASEKNFSEAENLMIEARKKIAEAHGYQTSIVQTEAAGKKYEYSLLMTHAMDTLMTIASEWNITENMLFLYKNNNFKSF